jgi:hypothetical protein
LIWPVAIVDARPSTSSFAGAADRYKLPARQPIVCRGFSAGNIDEGLRQMLTRRCARRNSRSLLVSVIGKEHWVPMQAKAAA